MPAKKTNEDRRVHKLIGKQLGSIRRQRQLTQETVAARMGVEPLTVSRWELGALAVSITTLIKLAKLCEVEVETILSPVIESKQTAARRKGEADLFERIRLLSGKDKKLVAMVVGRLSSR